MNLKKISISLLVLALLTSAAACVEAEADQNNGKGQQFPPPFLEGNRINIMQGTSTAPADEPCYVIHGWGTDVVPWKEFPPEWKKVLMSESSFSLSIDSEPVKLRKWNHHYREFIGYEDVMIVQFYVQFEANTFEADVEYVFTGSWIQEGVTLLVIENVVTFQ